MNKYNKGDSCYINRNVATDIELAVLEYWADIIGYPYTPVIYNPMSIPEPKM